MSEKKEKDNKKTIMRALIFAVIVGIIALVVWFLTYKSEKRTSTTLNEGDYGALECNSSAPNEPFFASESAQRSTHTIKILFTDTHVKEMSYRYEGTFNSDDSAEHASAWMHADYNKYMGKYKLNAESLNPVFSINKSKLMVTLYAEAEKFNSAVARLFFVNDEEFKEVGEYDATKYKKLYESKGFTCTIHK